MVVLVTYDVQTKDAAGRKRLRHVAKVCLDYGQRVQNSVFECKVDPAQYIEFKQRIVKIINQATDSVRFYNLGNNWKRRVEHFGAKEPYDIDGFLSV
jgi:CRISPR-associated protein Cas2